MIDVKSREMLSQLVESALAHASRQNLAKPEKYWYPLSMATYGVEEIVEALDSLCSFRTTMWEKTAEFEQSFARLVGSREAVMVNSGSSADLLAALLLADPTHPILRPGDEILVPAVTWPTQVWSPLMAGFEVRLVDVDPRTLNISIEDLARKIGPRTRGLFLVHLLGNPCRMEEILALVERHGLVLLEDCCEALGSRWSGRHVGTFGLAGTYSFFFSHHITTMEGGMVTVDDLAAADRLRILRAHGWLRNTKYARPPAESADIDPRYAFVGWGLNVRPTELQAGFGLRQLEKLPAFGRRRAELAAKFFAAIDRLPGLSRPEVEERAEPSWMALPLMVDADAAFSRNDLTRHLEIQGVETRPVVTGNLARQPAAKLFPGLKRDDLPGADEIHQRGLYVGLSPFVSDSDMDRLIEAIESFVGRQ